MKRATHRRAHKVTRLKATRQEQKNAEWISLLFVFAKSQVKNSAILTRVLRGFPLSSQKKKGSKVR
jgi:hypothetical protein